jgi:hypothetical protein
MIGSRARIGNLEVFFSPEENGNDEKGNDLLNCFMAG